MYHIILVHLGIWNYEVDSNIPKEWIPLLETFSLVNIRRKAEDYYGSLPPRQDPVKVFIMFALGPFQGGFRRKCCALASNCDFEPFVALVTLVERVIS